MKHNKVNDDVLLLNSGEGRVYNCGTMTALFKADENETNERYSVSEWILEPNSDGPGAHQHEENDEVFYMLEGVLSFLVGEDWINAEKGAFLRIPAKTLHDFKNESAAKAVVLNFFIPGGFERNMPAIVNWLEEKEKEETKEEVSESL